MKDPTREPGPVCGRCQKPLVRASCGGCGGNGYYRTMLFFKRQCQICHGSGVRTRCPDEFQHVLADFGVAGKLKEKPAYHSLRGGLSYKLPPSVKPGAAAPAAPPRQPPPGFTIPPPWHPSYPNPWHPAHPRSLSNPANPASPLHPSHRGPSGRR